MKEIELTKGFVALVDDADYEWLNQFSWGVCKGCSTNYAMTKIKQKCVLMHRKILGIKKRMIFSDHIDGNGLNNQRDNLRKSKPYQNSANRRPTKNTSSIYLGVSFKKQTGRWCASLEKRGVSRHLGYFSTEAEAALAYNKAAAKYHKQFANLNKII